MTQPLRDSRSRRGVAEAERVPESGILDRPIDRLVGAAVDLGSGQPELKATPVRVVHVAIL
jgi:hypothetical protein